MQIPADTHFIYVHGFNSSPKSYKARQTLHYFEQLGVADQLSVPELSHFPAEAIGQLRNLVERADRALLIGSSLGGFYSSWITEHYDNARAVLVNPAVAPHRLLSPLLGETENYHTGQRYDLTETHMQQLEALYLSQLNHPERLLLLQQEGDETLDYRDAVGYYSASDQIVQPGGSHAFDGFETMLPWIIEFASGTLDPEILTHVPRV
ncbi:MAG TPA: YqiA/YcfP family alpha/beta fold hydrolase [Marinobacterium sp.]|nr:YqiA/YcfP family alpha/beta fold hydrolase [Marinobacterium sp.]